MNEEQELRLRILGMLLPALSGECTDRGLIQFAKSLERYVTQVCTECGHHMGVHTGDDGCTLNLPRRGTCPCEVRS